MCVKGSSLRLRQPWSGEPDNPGVELDTVDVLYLLVAQDLGENPCDATSDQQNVRRRWVLQERQVGKELGNLELRERGHVRTIGEQTDLVLPPGDYKVLVGGVS